MKWIIPISLYLSIFCCFSLSAESLDPLEILYFCELNDLKALHHSFDTNDFISIQEARKFLLQTFDIINSQYPSFISCNQLKTKILEIVNICSIDQSLFEELKPLLFMTIDKLFANEKSDSSIVFIKSPLKQPTSEIEIPSSVIVGTTEIVCGVLLWLTPFKTLSVPLITDGLRRMGNAVEEKDKELRQYPERQYHPPKYH